MATGGVLIVGMGGLGSPAAMALAWAGAPHLTLVDHDVVAFSNLPRQFLYKEADVGKSKVEVAATRLKALAPSISVETVAYRFEIGNAETLCRGRDFIIDGTDNPESKFLLNDSSLRYGVPLSHAGVSGWLGQTLTVLPGRSACLRCLFPDALSEEDALNCRTSGILGGLAACFGSIQAAQAMAFLSGRPGDLLANRFLTYDGKTGRWQTLRILRQKSCPSCGISSIHPSSYEAGDLTGRVHRHIESRQG